MSNYTCIPAGFGSSCTYNCGNGIIDFGEDCDDNNAIDGDCCSATCQWEVGWTYDTPINPTCNEICGDGIRVGVEDCDSGKNVPANALEIHGCKDTCQGIKDGYYCPAANRTTPTGRDVCHVECHDTWIREHEECEDANADPLDGCHNCVIQPQWTCTSANGRYSQCIPFCGNGKVEGNEICDDNSPLDGKWCRADCSGFLPGWTCTTIPTVPPSPYLNSTCTSTCGDGIKVKDDEQCDDGNANDLDGCKNDCTIDPLFSCVEDPLLKSICLPLCGNGLRVDEQCDDYNSIDGDGCTKDCIIEGGYDCIGGSPTT